ncbi:MAG: hypothetical protein MUQ56_00080, partial [Thermoleophilia bacterium]|nr:hypothetical protein [Thermoleophilia bacterium]
MSAPRILLAPTHRTGLAGFLAAGIAEIVGAGRRQVRFHHLGAVSPAAAWDRWEGSSFLDPALYDAETLAALYERTVRGADLSVLTTSHGVIDDVSPGPWSPAGVARALDCPLALVLDCRGWGSGISALVKGFDDRLSGVNLAGLVLTGVRDHDHREVLRRALSGAPAPVVGCAYQGDGPGWDTPAPGPSGLPLTSELIETVHRHVDAAGLETLAGQRGFLAGGTSPPERRETGPLVALAGGRGFTAWSRDSIDALRAAGLRLPQRRSRPWRERPVAEAERSPTEGFAAWIEKNTAPQKQVGYRLVHVPLVLGDIPSGTLDKLADVVEAHG